MRKTAIAMVLGMTAGLVFFGVRAVPAADDPREMVELPPMMRDHMLGNMRDHLAALNEILAALAEGRTKDAGDVAEKRLGMSSLSAHGAEHMAPFMPERMRAIGTELHHAASRFVVATQNADLEDGTQRDRAIFSALQEVTGTCVSCHQAFRIH